MISNALKKDKSDALKKWLEEYLGIQFTCRYKAANYVMSLRYPDLKLISKIANTLELNIENQHSELKPYMSVEDINQLIAKGFTVGAHSIDHPEFYLLSEPDQIKQTQQSIQQIEEWFHPKYRVFAFPFTDVGVRKSFFETIEQQCKPDLTFGSLGIKKDSLSYHVNRIPMDDFSLIAENRLKSEYSHYFLKRFVGKNSYRRK